MQTTPELVQQERKLAKKMMRAGLTAAFCGGGGLAIFLLQRIFSGLTSSDTLNANIDSACLLLMVYAGAIFASFVFLRAWLPKIHLVMFYIVIPIVLFQIFSGPPPAP